MQSRTGTVYKMAIATALFSLALALVLWLGGQQAQGFFAASWALAILSLGAFITVSDRQEERTPALALAGAELDGRAILARQFSTQTGVDR